MKWLKNLLLIFKSWIGKTMGQFGNKRPIGSFEKKPPRPHVQKAWISIVIDDQICQTEVFVIVLNGEIVFDTPIFPTEKEANFWLDKNYPECDYAPSQK